MSDMIFKYYCHCCHRFLKPVDFDIKYNGTYYKTCNECRLKQRKRYNKNVCKHNKSFQFMIKSKTVEPILKILNESGLHYEQISDVNEPNMNEPNMNQI